MCFSIEKSDGFDTCTEVGVQTSKESEPSPDRGKLMSAARVREGSVVSGLLCIFGTPSVCEHDRPSLRKGAPSE